MNTKAINPFNNWGLKHYNHPFTIAGPCSAESEEQVLETARLLKNQGIEVFRAGIWKPRTRPNSFEGVGSIGLNWLKLVKSELGMMVATEVANVRHIDEVLKFGIDVLWIGARTTTNPFATQEIANALKGIENPILVKNPVNPDVDLWQGAIERIMSSGVKNIGAVHRGFSTFGKTRYRNVPHWQIPIELKRRLPEIPMICDPSHIGGKRELLGEISQKAMDLNYDGLIIETHNNPDKALSDAKQQVTPKVLETILNKLVIRNSILKNNITNDTLEYLRQKIDKIDEELLQMLEERMKVSEEIGIFKKENNITILQPNRWQKILDRALEKGNSLNLSDEFLNKLFKAMHQESINKQTKVMNID